ncbi:MAG: glycerophosphodiester phosphodiesterase [Gemmatimonadota bacterium]
MRRIPEIISHRGVHGVWRENTLAAFAEALATEPAGIELDVHLTADRVVVVHHDPAVDLGGGRRLVIRESKAAEVIGARKGDDSIPTLDAVFELAGGKTRLHVEVKAAGMAESVVSVLARHRSKPASVHSFHHPMMRRVKELDPSVSTGVAVASYLIDPAAALRAARADTYWCHWEFIDEALIAALGERAKVIAWTVNEGDLAIQLARAGVAGICTDFPAEIRRAFA